MQEVLFKYNDSTPDIIRCLVVEDGISRNKTIPISEFFKICRKVNQKEERFKVIGELPHGYISGALGEEPDTFRCLMCLPSGIRGFGYKGETFTIPMPELIFSFSVSNGVLTKDFCCVRIDEKLYNYPFGNVYDSHHICWGNCLKPKLSRMVDCEKLVTQFVGAETNDDLYHNVVVGKGKKALQMTQRQLLNYLNGKKEWPKDIRLVQMSENIQQLVEFKNFK